MDRYFVTHCSKGGKAYRFGTIAEDPAEAEDRARMNARRAGMNIDGLPAYTEEITEKEYNEL